MQTAGSCPGKLQFPSVKHTVSLNQQALESKASNTTTPSPQTSSTSPCETDLSLTKASTQGKQQTENVPAGTVMSVGFGYDVIATFVQCAFLKLVSTGRSGKR
jgi:hypothetical protein